MVWGLFKERAVAKVWGRVVEASFDGVGLGGEDGFGANGFCDPVVEEVEKGFALTPPPVEKGFSFPPPPFEKGFDPPSFPFVPKSVSPIFILAFPSTFSPVFSSFFPVCSVFFTPSSFPDPRLPLKTLTLPSLLLQALFLHPST